MIEIPQDVTRNVAHYEADDAVIDSSLTRIDRGADCIARADDSRIS